MAVVVNTGALDISIRHYDEHPLRLVEPHRLKSKVLSIFDHFHIDLQELLLRPYCVYKA